MLASTETITLKKEAPTGWVDPRGDRDRRSPPSQPTTSQPPTSKVWPTASTRISQTSQEGHVALDIAASIGTPIYASSSGTIVQVRNQPQGYGTSILMRTADGIYELLYGHLSGVNVRTGQKVKAGQVIGAVGSTGASTGPHLHFEVRKSGLAETFKSGWRSATSAISPMSYLGLTPSVIAGVASVSQPTALNRPVLPIKKSAGEEEEPEPEEGTGLFSLKIPIFEELKQAWFPTEEREEWLKTRGIATVPIRMLSVGVGVMIVLIALWRITEPQRTALMDAGKEAAQLAKSAATLA